MPDNIMSFIAYLALEMADIVYDDFEAGVDTLDEAVQDEMLAHAKLLERFGRQLGRPGVDTLNGSRHKNMKKLRFEADLVFGA